MLNKAVSEASLSNNLVILEQHNKGFSKFIEMTVTNLATSAAAKREFCSTK